MTVTLANNISYFSLEEASGTRIDQRPAGNDLSQSGNPGNAAGIVDNAVSLVRLSTQYLYITDAAQVGLDITGNITISAWIRLSSLPSAAGQWFAVVSKFLTTGNQRSYLLAISNTLDKAFFMVSPDGAATSFVTANNFGSLSIDTWYYLYGIYDGVNLTVAVNGVENTTPYALGIFNSTAGFRIGNDSGVTRHFNGRIDEVSIWNEAASAGQRASFYNGGAALSYAGTRALFDVTVTPTTSQAIADTSGPISVVTPFDCGVSIMRQPFTGEYQLYFVDPLDGSPIDLVPVGSRIHSLKYVLKLDDIGDVRFTIDSTDRLVSRIINREDILCDLYRRNQRDGPFEIEKTFLVRFYDLFEEDIGRESVIFAGVSLEHLLKRRLIVPDDDPLGAGGFSTKSGPADIVMNEFVREQAVNPASNFNRSFPGLILAPFVPISIRTAYQRRKQEDTLLEVLQDIAYSSDVDFQVRRGAGNQLEFLPQKIGSDKTAIRNEFYGRPFVVFSDKRANIQEPRLTYDRRDESTYMFVAAQGLESDRIYVPVNSTRSIASPYNRIEALIDSRDDDSIDEILDTGIAEIQKTLGKVVFDWKVAFGQAQTRYNVDWGLGDTVTAEYKDITQQFRLWEMQVEVKADGEHLTPKWRQEL